MTGFTFDRAVAVEAGGDGVWRGEIHDGWDIGGIANGGYLLALMAGPMAEVAGFSDPLTITAHYLAPASAGPVTVRVEGLRAGRRLATVRGELRRGDTLLVQSLATFGDAAETGGEVSFDAGMPQPADPEACIGREAGDRIAFPPPPITEKVDVRIDPDHVGFQVGRPTGDATIGGWQRFVDGRPVDTKALLLMSDTFPPAVFNSGLPIGWTPTIELTVHIHKRPAAGWIGSWFTTDHINNGFLEEDGILWDEAGDVVAMSRQFAVVPRG